MSNSNGTGWETGDTIEIAATGGTFSIVTSPTAGPWSAYALRCNPTTSGTGFNRLMSLSASSGAGLFALPTPIGYVRFMFRYATAPAANSEQFFHLGGTTATNPDFALRLNSAGTVAVYQGGTSLAATGSTVLSGGTGYRIEVKYDQTGGVNTVWEVKINGASEVSGSFAKTLTINSSYFGKASNRNGQTVDFFYDDALISDSTYPGDGRNTLLVPNGNGTYQTGSIGAGGAVAHYTVVDDVPNNGDTDYLLSSGASLGDAETEALTDTATAAISGTINAVKSLHVLKQDNAAAAVRLRLRSGGTDSDTTTSFNPTAAYTLAARLFDTDPATSSAWTTSGVDGVEVGIVERASGLKTRMTFCGLAVDWTPSGGATNYSQSLAGTVTPSSTIAKTDSKPLTGTVTPSGATVAKADGKGLTGTTTPSSILTKSDSKPLYDSTVLSEALSKGDSKGLSGTSAPSGGAVTKDAGKGLVGTVTPSSSLSKVISKALVAATSLAGLLGAILLRSLSFMGTLTPDGAAVTKGVSKPLSGPVTMTGSLAKTVSQSLSGVITVAGAVAKAVGRAFAGLLSLVGSLSSLSVPVQAPPNIRDTVYLRRTVEEATYLKQTTADTINLKHTSSDTILLGD